MRLTGHKLTIEWNGEYGEESASIGTCACGWQESGGNRSVVRDEYGYHLQREKRELEEDQEPPEDQECRFCLHDPCICMRGEGL